ncbi:fluoride efflux transporter CrcB [Microbulbifer thermotolerans]|uniref:Fluoride-specific ion channel FluC n=1 Tax=Microbulbifer thermotolerans TaxID=252514 RepID=A0A143HLH5_MICTH|nr:fluoride efflux transporter CrcB [Microbulbifer thermotolerans]AMX02543.1 camphor resistance protein CrcB [Microbulbifer thermotolerans]MCX2779402.1 fluoride efflux transporter CrcB [Microbulbifer thermotolerans]MCX2782394.1 fluoride efflux transporter CrcB [Microbulbifer thermotolerans]MCX2794979.1 fluoride efflux transporter CrcB [Microbulbifer thermotolerans]MCX2800547.1 fluoride efflux transporter CrcB [Microbulbifer thermotolerans]
MQWLAIAVGGALGAMLRHLVTIGSFNLFGGRFPYGTLIVNVIGSFLIGIAYVLIVERALLGQEWRLMLTTGFFGALTTFSTFSLETVMLWHNGQPLTALANILVSLMLSLSATFGAIALTMKYF